MRCTAGIVRVFQRVRTQNLTALPGRFKGVQAGLNKLAHGTGGVHL